MAKTKKEKLVLDYDEFATLIEDKQSFTNFIIEFFEDPKIPNKYKLNFHFLKFVFNCTSIKHYDFSKMIIDIILESPLSITKTFSSAEFIDILKNYAKNISNSKQEFFKKCKTIDNFKKSFNDALDQKKDYFSAMQNKIKNIQKMEEIGI